MDSHVRNNRGNTLNDFAEAEGRAGGDPRETLRRAIADYDEALRRNPANVEARFNRGST